MKASITLPLAAALMLTACASALENRPAPDIAAKAYRSYDSYTGLEQTVLPQISPFKWGDNVRGSARLQTAEAFEGQGGGAWLDVVLNYNTPSTEPSEMRVYNKVRWAGGDQAKLADFTAAVQSCSDKVTSYGSDYGYGGFGRSGSYGGLRGGLRGGVGGGYGHGGYGGGYRPSPKPSVNPDPVPAPDSDTGNTPVRTYTNPYARLGKFDPSTRVEPHARIPSSALRSTAKSARPIVSRPARAPQRVSKPITKSVSKPVSRPVSKPTSRPKPPSRAKTARSKVSRKLNFMDEQTARLVASNTKSNSVAHRPIRSLSHRFGYNHGYYGGGGLGYGYPQTEYVITSACLRREKLRIFVPKDRLLAAERYGLTLLIRAASGDERTLNITPNYVMGYQMASYAPQLAQR